MSVRSTEYFDHKVWVVPNQVVVALLVGSTYRVGVCVIIVLWLSLFCRFPLPPPPKLSPDLLHWSLGGSMRKVDPAELLTILNYSLGFSLEFSMGFPGGN
ncbi:hypothetical protein BO82DRAFT_16870 [Aspergillus uvarum CBS 121591]|uniref:Uncharacterized protein n=1 Tax=Aspergillus uvarum CBS 121591 TaxID=1448315 RepID=A0A319CKF3_9EURO|nr:hypothetical protein BO82DRAFT_16870 [Aspergillus uvarum CBS 121591]PYH84351.1 hypothetical protein BO82DRAFT_16870 [Aspergillus uvarum CBS 121591]